MAAKQNRQVAERLSVMDRADLIGLLRSVHCNFELDFTDEFLGEVSIERLRHIVLGALLHDNGSRLGARRNPD